LYGVSELTLTYHKRGIGQTGARHFKYYSVPAIRYWNPDVVVNVVKIDDAPRVSASADDAESSNDTNDTIVASNDSAAAAAATTKEATLVVRFVDGRKRVVSATGRSNQEISDSLKSFMSNPKPIQSMFPSVARASSN
jgi:hypothetical protein